MLILTLFLTLSLAQSIFNDTHFDTISSININYSVKIAYMNYAEKGVELA